MAQKIIAGRAESPRPAKDLVRAKVDQVVIAREPAPVLTEAMASGLGQPCPEVTIAYQPKCIGVGLTSQAVESQQPAFVEAVERGVLLAKPGIGFPPSVHIERFACPARLAITDEPRLAAVGGIGMLTLVVPRPQLAEAIATGFVALRRPHTIEILLSGRTRTFVCMRDVVLELVRRGLQELVEKVDREHDAPVVLEFAGPSARLLSVSDRAVLCSVAPQVGAAGAVFVSDEKTEVYLRDQRRSKAHRALAPDPGAPCDEVLTLDLSAVDPLIMDQRGKVLPVREMADAPVSQVVLGGDGGSSLRDLLAAASLLKSKRVPPSVEFLLSAPSRQTLEVLAQTGALVDLIATGARLIEPDIRVTNGELYPPAGGLSLRSFDMEPSALDRARLVTASSETLAYAVANGVVGDPRAFKRPVRITLPRALPTDDVLIVRRAKVKNPPASSVQGRAQQSPTQAESPVAARWQAATTLCIGRERQLPTKPTAMVLGSLEDVRWAAHHAPALARQVTAIVAEHIPAGLQPLFASLGVLALTADSGVIEQLSNTRSLTMPAVDANNGASVLRATADDASVDLTWRAIGIERDWLTLGNTRSAAPADTQEQR